MADFDGRDRAKELEDVVVDSFDDYQKATAQTAVYPGQNQFLGILYVGLGVGGESGEIVDHIKKTWRDDGADLIGEVFRQIDLARVLILEDASPDKIELVFDQLRERVSFAFNPPLDEERKAKIEKEIGDELWYLSQLATEIHTSLGGIAQGNINKLRARWRSDTIHGEGDDREERPATTTHTRPDPLSGGPDLG